MAVQLLLRLKEKGYLGRIVPAVLWPTPVSSATIFPARVL
jgi:hypothetical protein